MVTMTIHISGNPDSFPVTWTVEAALAKLGHSSREVALARQDGTLAGSGCVLGDALSNDEQLSLVRL